MAQLNAYLSFNGDCAEAMRLYERVLNGKIEMMMTNGQSPMCEGMPASSKDRIAHARLSFDAGVLMAGDAMENCPYEGMKGISMTLTYPTAAEAQPVFDGLAEGAKITMPFQKTFWADASGMLVDRFGTPWIINGGLQPVGH